MSLTIMSPKESRALVSTGVIISLAHALAESGYDKSEVYDWAKCGLVLLRLTPDDYEYSLVRLGKIYGGSQ